MATKEYIQDRLTNVTAKIEKAQATIAKKQKLILKKQAELAKMTDENDIYWQKCDIDGLEYDVKRKQKELEKDLIPSKEKWESELAKVTSKVRDIQPILDFLKLWKERVVEFYNWQRNSDERKAAKAEVAAAYKVCVDLEQNGWKEINYDTMTREEAQAKYKELCARKKAAYDEYSKLQKQYASDYSIVLTWEGMAQSKNTTFEDIMDKELDRECEAKYDDLVARISEYCGDILDCSYLTVSPKGNIDGYVIGSKADAEVRTIPAEGPLRRFHYRILVYARDKQTHKIIGR